MRILTQELEWGAPLAALERVDFVVLHHSAGSGSLKQVHDYHRYVNGWSGIAYHLYVRRDGTVWRARPIDARGAHCRGWNDRSIGICFEGNFDREEMGKEQLDAGREAVRYVLGIYPGAIIAGHGELCTTACPGKFFPLAELKEVGKTVKSGDVCPEWARREYERAAELGITDGTRPGEYVPRYQAAVMAMRAAEAAVKMMKEEFGHENG